MGTTSLRIGKARNGSVRGRAAFFLAIIVAAVLQTVSPAEATDTALDRIISIDIPANTRLENALIEWGAKAGVTVMMNAKTVQGMITGKVQGTLSAQKALMLILEGSGLSFMEEGQRIVVVPTSASQRLYHQTYNVDYTSSLTNISRFGSQADPTEIAVGKGMDNTNTSEGKALREALSMVRLVTAICQICCVCSSYWVTY